MVSVTAMGVVSEKMPERSTGGTGGSVVSRLARNHAYARASDTTATRTMAGTTIRRVEIRANGSDPPFLQANP